MAKDVISDITVTSVLPYHFVALIIYSIMTMTIKIFCKTVLLENIYLKSIDCHGDQTSGFTIKQLCRYHMMKIDVLIMVDVIYGSFVQFFHNRI